MKNTKIHTIYTTLLDYFGYQNWWPIVDNNTSLYLPEFRTRQRTPAEIFEIAVGAILTQNTNWQNVEKALINLKTDSVLNIETVRDIETERLAGLIKPSGYFNQKAKKLKLFVEFIDGELHGDIMSLRDFDIDTARKMLLSVWGIGKETADSILLYGYYFPIFVVDAYTRRIFLRAGIVDKAMEYDNIQGIFEDNLPVDSLIYREYHALIVKLGVECCRKKSLCENCILREKSLCSIEAK